MLPINLIRLQKKNSAYRRFLTVLTLLSVSSLFLISCRRETAPPLTLTYLWSGNFNPNFKVLTKMTELTNVRLEVTAIPEIDYSARRDAILLSGDIPDVVTKTTDSLLIQRLGMEGKLLPIDEYFDQLPNFTALIEKNHWESVIQDNTAVDGHMYQLPMFLLEERICRKQQFIREDILEELNLEIPRTWEELYAVCKTVKAHYPDCTPIGVVYGSGNLLDMVSPAFGTSGGWGARRNFYHYDQKSGQWIFTPETEEFQQMLLFLNRLYREGLLDPDYSSLSSSMYYEKVSSGQYFFLVSEWPQFDAKTFSDSEDAVQWTPIYPLAGPAGAFTPKTSWYSQGCVFSADLKENGKLEKFLQWLNWLYSEESILLLSYGIEGESYEKTPDGKIRFLPNIHTEKNPEGTEYMSIDWGLSQNSLTFVYPSQNRKAPAELTPCDALIQQEAEKGIVTAPTPQMALTAEQTIQENSAAAKLVSYADSMVERFISGSRPFEEYPDFIQECYVRGSGELTALYNAVWQEQRR